MYLVLVILVVIVCTLLGLIVLIQNPKGGGLSSNFSSSSQLMGVQKTGDFLEKGTWVLAITLMVLALAINIATKGGITKVDSQYNEQIQKSLKAPANAPAAFPTAPATAPGQAPAPAKK
ncbi:preprotein translocase subunit SecG [Mucilaginibacter sp.]|uniref:preprotein translocase subunit SecG n=1 Tax=Mucilaginibacter sp. TaxID=1882438 RepID=UPI0026338146|nr:preprotein translocase subunit SecG [Mucilaginibacter sp.]MDB5030411.1 preprotein translocase subunit SecG [Mucilaginibacter sp.]